MPFGLKKIYKFLFIFLLLICNSCEKEYEEQKTDVKHVQIIQKSFNELIKDKTFINSYLKTKNEAKKLAHSSTHKSSTESIYDFDFADVPIRVAYSGNTTSYTILIKPNSFEADYFENLVIQVNSITKLLPY